MKMIKLSLITALTIGSFSAVNAQDLTEAIANIDISGTVAYRYNDYQENASKDNSATSNNYKLSVNLKSKVNDDITFNSRVISGNKADGGPIPLDTQSNEDGNVDVFLSQINFVYTGLSNTALTFGKQAINTPFTMATDAIGNENTGTGISGVINLGPVNLNAAYFNQTNIKNSNETSFTYNGGADVATVGLSTSVAGLNFDANYIDIQDVFDAYSVGISAAYDVAGINLNPYARYSALDLDNSNLDNSLWKVGMKAQMGIFGAYVSYGETNEEGGTVGIDASSDSGMDDHWRVTLSTISDASVLYAAVDTQVTDKLNIALKYSDLNAGDKSNSTDQNEIYVQALYKMSSNFTSYVRFGQYERKDAFAVNSDLESTIGRVHLQYTF